MRAASAASFLNVADWVVIALYLLGIMVLGVWFGKDQRTTRDYFLGSRTVPWWGVGLSIVAAETSALTVIGVPSLAYRDNLLFVQMVVGYVLARLVLAVVMVPHYFKGEIYSPYQLFADTFGPAVRRTAGGIFLLSETLAAGVRVYVACIPVQLMLGLQVLPAILLFVVLSLVYTYIGGVKAVIWTDALQFVLFLAGGAFAVVYIPLLIDGGWSAAIHEAAAAGKLVWLNTNLAAANESGFLHFLQTLLHPPFNIWMGVLGGTFVTLSSHGAEQLVVQRVLTCKSVADGRKALALSAVLILPLFLIFLLAGVMLWVYYAHFPFAIPLPESRPGMPANDFIFPIFMLTAVPNALRGFLIVAILAAAMSSVSSALTSLASVSTMDFARPHLRDRDEGFYLRFSKRSTLFWAAALVLVGFLSRKVEFVLNTAFSLRGLTSGALLGGLYLAVAWKRTPPLPVIAGMAASVVTLLGIQVLPKLAWTSGWWTRVVGGEIFWPWYTLIGTAITVCVAWTLRGRARADASEVGPTSA